MHIGEDGKVKVYLEQLDWLLNFYHEHKKHNEHGEYLTPIDSSIFISATLSSIDKIAGSNSAYAEQMRGILEACSNSYASSCRERALGIIHALRHDIESGFITSVREIIHGEVFGDFLEMAHYLANEGYKDAAAVIGGGVLESHLKQLCIKFGIDTEFINPRGDTESKKADRLNADLKKSEVYNGLEQKSITTWLDLRNKAAHSQYEEYTKEEVTIFLSWLTDFLTRHPA